MSFPILSIHNNPKLLKMLETLAMLLLTEVLCALRCHPILSEHGNYAREASSDMKKKKAKTPVDAA